MSRQQRPQPRSIFTAALLTWCIVLAACVRCASARCPFSKEPASASITPEASSSAELANAGRELSQLGGYTPSTTTATPYMWNCYGDPPKKDWASVVSACRSVGAFEKRINNFFIRAAFHDALAVRADCLTCGGLDASLLTNVSELLRPENTYENFALTSSRAALKISRWFNVSASDVLAICGATAVQSLGGPDIISPVQGLPVFRVGRQDSNAAAPAGQLPPANVSAQGLADFWTARGFTVQEGMALMGTHALLDEQECFRGANGSSRDWCDPSKEPCTDVRMFRWSNQYYVDLCTPAFRVLPETAIPDMADFNALDPPDPLRRMTADEFRKELRQEMCKWTSNEFRAAAQKLAIDIRTGAVTAPLDAKFPTEPLWNDVTREQCASSPYPAVRNNCPHPQPWFYTVSDAFVAEVCQPDATTPISPALVDMRNALLRYLDPAAWAAEFPATYRKMVSVTANFINGPNGQPAMITGTECYSGYSTDDPSLPSADTCDATACPPGPRSANCPSLCRCKNAFDENGWSRALTASADMPKPGTPISTGPDLWVPPVAIPEGIPEPLAMEAPFAPDVTVTLPPPPAIPPSPYGVQCPTTDTVYLVGGYPSSGFVIKPFTETYRPPPVSTPLHTVCRPAAAAAPGAPPHCMVTHNITVSAFQARPWDKTIPGCASRPATWFLGYNGVSPGPTITATVGHELMVRFNNAIDPPATAPALIQGGHEPCDTATRRGRPISIHHHGSASLAPYDGWADDELCTGESKEYIYPNQRPTTTWYHDHAIHITLDNAYAGLTSFYIMSSKKKHGGCGEPYNLEDIEERLFIFGDKVLDNRCQLYYDFNGPHRNNLYGDINVINGVPFPDIPLSPKWYRFRLLVGGPTRPYLIKIKDATGADVAPKICKIIATDGGYRPTPAPFGPEGLLIGVSERYELVCDFTAYANKILYLWNGRNEKMQKAVPYFCLSHLLGRISVGPPLATPAPAFNPAAVPEQPSAINKVLSAADIAQAQQLIAQKAPHRTFKFGRRNGQWVINGETWDTNKIAADDVGHNTWELWRLQTGGGWFHPIHVHLVDFIVLQRNNQAGNDGLFAYERNTPKDVVYLGPGNDIWLIARFGAHRGSYMFHCHNLDHEDHDMLRAFTIIGGANQDGIAARNPSTELAINTVAGVIYNNYGYNDPMWTFTAAQPSANWPALTTTYSSSILARNVYRIFYPNVTDLAGLQQAANPWFAPVCQLPGTTLG